MWAITGNTAKADLPIGDAYLTVGVCTAPDDCETTRLPVRVPQPPVPPTAAPCSVLALAGAGGVRIPVGDDYVSVCEQEIDGLEVVDANAGETRIRHLVAFDYQYVEINDVLVGLVWEQ